MVTKFRYSQANFQDFQDCHRRFFLRYIRKLAWPAVESQPVQKNEIFREQGVSFHRMIQQYFLGIPEETLSSLNLDDPLHGWWQNFIESKMNLPAIHHPQARIFPEYTLNTDLGKHRLSAKFDLLVVLDNQITIFDWKTSHRRPEIRFLEKRLQSIVYPFLAARSGPYLLQDKVGFQPENIKLFYWFAEFPDQPIILSYSQKKMESDYQYLLSISNEIENLGAIGEEAFTLTQEEKMCDFCVYRSLCNRGISAGIHTIMEDFDAANNLTFDLDQIDEIEF